MLDKFDDNKKHWFLLCELNGQLMTSVAVVDEKNKTLQETDTIWGHEHSEMLVNLQADYLLQKNITLVDLRAMGASVKHINGDVLTSVYQETEGDNKDIAKDVIPALFMSAIEPEQHFLVLRSCGNIDFGQDPNASISDEIVVAIDNIDVGKSEVLNYISNWELGGGNWCGGDVLLDGRVVARYSYNGRLWTPGEWFSDKKPIDTLPV